MDGLLTALLLYCCWGVARGLSTCVASDGEQLVAALRDQCSVVQLRQSVALVAVQEPIRIDRDLLITAPEHGGDAWLDLAAAAVVVRRVPARSRASYHHRHP